MSQDADARGVVDLDELGNAVSEPDASAGAVARDRLERSAPDAGRLATLAQWWAAVRGDDRAAAPQRVHHVGVATTPDPAVAALELPAGAPVGDALAWGVTTADTLADSGADLLLLTVPDAFAARLVAAELMGLDPIEANGWPQDRDVDDETWMDEVVELRDGLRRTAGLRGDLTALLTAVGSSTVAAAAALVVQATVRRTPILLDGPGAASAALVARRTAYVANQWWQAGHGDADQMHGRCLRSLTLEPLTSLGVRAEDGTGALLGLDVLRHAVRLLGRDDPDPDVPDSDPQAEPAASSEA